MSYQSVDLELSEGKTHCHIYDKNDGDWVVLVHGLVTPQFAWGYLFEDLVKAGYNVVSFDLYGRGQSDIPNINYSFPVFLQQLNEVVERLLKDKTFHIIGWSMGGALSSIYAMENSHRIKKVVLIAPGIIISNGQFIKQKLKHELASKLFIKVGERLLKSRMQQHFHSTSDTSHYTEKAITQITRPGFWPSLISIIVNYPEDLLQQLENYSSTAPAPLIVWGESDTNTPFEDSEAICKLLKGDLFSVENAAHAVHYEYPELVNKRIIQHLA